MDELNLVAIIRSTLRADYINILYKITHKNTLDHNNLKSLVPKLAWFNFFFIYFRNAWHITTRCRDTTKVAFRYEDFLEPFKISRTF